MSLTKVDCTPTTTNKEITEAIKKAKSEIKEDNYFKISLGYSSGIIVPAKDAVKIVEALSNAMTYKENYGTPTKIIDNFDKESLTIHPVTTKEVLRYKLNYILKIESKDDSDELPF